MEKLTEAINGLEVKPLDKTELKKLIAKYEALELDKYTEETLLVLENAHNMIETTQEEIDLKVEKFNEAINGLILKPLDKSKLNELKNRYSLIDKNEYTKESITNLENAYIMPETTQEEIDDKVLLFEEALNNLEVKPLDKTKLNEVANQYNLLDKSKYTKESLEMLDAAYYLPESTQEEIDLKVEKLTEALNNLEEKKEEPEVTPEEETKEEPEEE